MCAVKARADTTGALDEATTGMAGLDRPVLATSRLRTPDCSRWARGERELVGRGVDGDGITPGKDGAVADWTPRGVEMDV